MWKVSWLYEKVHNFLVVPLYYMCQFICITVCTSCGFLHNSYTMAARDFADIYIYPKAQVCILA